MTCIGSLSGTLPHYITDTNSETIICTGLLSEKTEAIVLVSLQLSVRFLGSSLSSLSLGSLSLSSPLSLSLSHLLSPLSLPIPSLSLSVSLSPPTLSLSLSLVLSLGRLSFFSLSLSLSLVSLSLSLSLLLSSLSLSPLFSLTMFFYFMGIRKSAFIRLFSFAYFFLICIYLIKYIAKTVIL